MATLPSTDEMYDAIVRKDAAYDGVFFTAVKTTGIFCRPICPARKPKAGNVEFFTTAREALLAGYRRCRSTRRVFSWTFPIFSYFSPTGAIDAAPTDHFVEMSQVRGTR